MRIEITVLGLLLEKDLYGYEIKKKIAERMDGFLDVKFGSIYYAIKKALKRNWVKKVGTEKDGQSPERYIYQILPEGKKRFSKALRQYFDNTLIHFDIDIVLMFFNSLSDEDKEFFIENRLTHIKDKLASVKESIKKATEKSSKTNNSQIQIYTYLENHLKAEQTWLKSLQ
ncbi:MAG: PadR family transcriptional regulator [Spirochaetes bacterium]|nr:PadR family transcriptional regulator [Spirochaetota bacterium]